MITNCRSCGETLYNGHNLLSGLMGPARPHQCSPVWEARVVTSRPDDSEWEAVHARDAEQAAEKFAEQHDSNCGDYPILNSGEETVEVRREGAAESQRFEVRAESVPQYHAGPAS